VTGAQTMTGTMTETMTPPTTRSRGTAALLLAAALAACGEGSPAEVRDDAPTFPVRASWSASAAPVGTSTVRATVALKEHLGSRIEATLTLTGAPNTAYQWRIVRGDCTGTVAAVNATAPTGLWTFATAESYPNATTNAAGTATVTRTIAGALDSLAAYSVRVRVAQTQTTWHGTTPIACGNLQRSQGG
jgi:hypothetical protein